MVSTGTYLTRVQRRSPPYAYFEFVYPRRTAFCRQTCGLFNLTLSETKRTSLCLGPFVSSVRQKERPLVSPLYQNSAFLGVRGKETTSRMLVIPVRYITNLSKPRPKPACLTPPYFLVSRYHQCLPYLIPFRPFFLQVFLSSSADESLTPGTKRSIAATVLLSSFILMCLDLFGNLL